MSLMKRMAKMLRQDGIKRKASKLDYYVISDVDFDFDSRERKGVDVGIAVCGDGKYSCYFHDESYEGSKYKTIDNDEFLDRYNTSYPVDRDGVVAETSERIVSKLESIFN
jgi:hypothetical protein